MKHNQQSYIVHALFGRTGRNFTVLIDFRPFRFAKYFSHFNKELSSVDVDSFLVCLLSYLFAGLASQICN